MAANMNDALTTLNAEQLSSAVSNVVKLAWSVAPVSLVSQSPVINQAAPAPIQTNLTTSGMYMCRYVGL